VSIWSGVQTQFTPDLVDAADRVMLKAQKDSWPEYLFEGETVTFWDIEDPLKATKETA
jgi:fructose-specific phosphotransferase system component IIB|tara:strand:- start:1385 stop:1558 length:174 start_codon:yes stop_codon:yes gene_type:complete